ncbi:MAG: GNAT family N-acetyltransferase [Bacteroidetes bacterium]|nr:GNAT family N-acetyltransferase [Bacteroidota bacterium]
MTFSLGHTIELDSFFKTKLKKKSEEVLSPIPNELVHYDVKNLPKESLILEDGHYQVYYSSALNLPSALKQIGILREQSMRDQERGTGKKMDIDEFDVFYYQVFIWDKKQLKILGGFRMSFCDWILQHYGKKGLYSNRLFQYDNKMNEFLLESIEIGKIFFANKLKEDDQMIHLMWKIISTIHLKFNQYKHIISTLEMDLISSDFQKNPWWCFSNNSIQKKISKSISALGRLTNIDFHRKKN